MKEFWEKVKVFLKKYWSYVVGALAVVAGAFLYGKSKSTTQVNLGDEKTPVLPPKKIEAHNVVKEYEKEKETTDAKIDKQSRSDLVHSINNKYGKGSGTNSGSGSGSTGST